MRKLHRPGHTLDHQHQMHHEVHADVDPLSMVASLA
jgi:hypothetical protein